MNTPFLKRLSLALFAFVIASSTLKAEEKERWYVVRMQGKHSGWVREQTTESNGMVTSDSQMHMAIRRGPLRIEMDQGMSFVETADGKPVSATVTQKMSLEEVKKAITFKPDGIEIVTTQGKNPPRTDKYPLISEPWLTPHAASKYVDKQITAGEKKVKFRTMDPSESLRTYEVTIEVLGKKEVEVYGRTVPALELAMTMSNLPGAKMTEFADEKGEMLKTTMDFGGIQLEILAADKALATAMTDPPELMASTLVKPSFTLLRPREMKAATYRMSIADGKMPDLEESVVQKVRRVDDLTLEVDIDLSRSKNGNGEPPKVKNNAMIAGDDPVIIALAKKATEDLGPEKAQRAEALRKYVNRHMKLAGLNVGMASASEVARTHAGDCTEFGVLLAAMCQADGIPARVASGLIYVPNFLGKQQIFGYHMWTQAFIDGRWVDLDATLPETPFDAAHILLNTSHQDNDEEENSMVTLGPLMGKLKIDMAEKK